MLEHLPCHMKGHSTTGLVTRHDSPVAGLVLLALLLTDIASLKHNYGNKVTHSLQATCTCTVSF